MQNARPVAGNSGAGAKTAGEDVPVTVTDPTDGHAVPDGVDRRYLDDTAGAARWRADLAERIWQQQRRKDAGRRP